jgi:hypothetical protein
MKMIFERGSEKNVGVVETEKNVKKQSAGEMERLNAGESLTFLYRWHCKIPRLLWAWK